jgi:lipopolysaccharide transport system ATP-binding protein
MMTGFAIRVQDLGKQFRIGRPNPYQAMHEALEALVRRPFRRGVQPERNTDDRAGTGAHYIWALQHVSFDAAHGEVIGLIGGNGAGKSVLLKILARVTKPTTGYAEIHGRVGAMLEVDAGFHPELNGLENIYLSGAALGMEKTRIDRMFDDIVAFSEVAPFLDTPVKRYSNGMRVRLAFAVAIHLEPEILMIDEVLAVADRSFREKSLQKLEDLAARGCAILMVSHSMETVTSLCSRVILLSRGQMVMDGKPEEVVACYQEQTRTNKVC